MKPAYVGRIAIADREPGEGLRLILDNGLFYEFIPPEELGRPEPRRLWTGTAETGVDYALAVTSCAGLWSYLLGDTVVLTGRTPPRLRISGRLSQQLSAFGEHLGAGEIEEAVAAAGLMPPEMRLAPPGTFVAWMRARGQLGGQHKVPRIMTDRLLLQSLLEVMLKGV